MRYLGSSATEGVGVGGARALSFPFLEGPGPGVTKGVWGIWVGAGAWGPATRANRRCDRSRMDAPRSASARGGL